MYLTHFVGVSLKIAEPCIKNLALANNILSGYIPDSTWSGSTSTSHFHQVALKKAASRRFRACNYPLFGTASLPHSEFLQKCDVLASALRGRLMSVFVNTALTAAHCGHDEISWDLM